MLHHHRHSNTLSPDALEIITRDSATWPELDGDRLEHLVDLTRRFLDHTDFESAGGAVLDDTMRVTIALHASRLVLFYDVDAYHNVHSVIVYPSAMIHRGERGTAPGSPVCNATPMPILGEAMLHGPVVLAWDAVARDIRHPERGRNVVYHEFAHTLDMLTGASNGMPPVGGRPVELKWKAMMDATLTSLRNAAHEDPVLGSYAETNAAECFAVATEVFFTTPQRLATAHSKLYEALAGFYHPQPGR